jgi:hypothetical protein
VTIEIAVGLCLLRIFELAHIFWLAVNKPIGTGTLFALPTFGLLAGRPKIDEFCHSILDGSWALAWRV